MSAYKQGCVKCKLSIPKMLGNSTQEQVFGDDILGLQHLKFLGGASIWR